MSEGVSKLGLENADYIIVGAGLFILFIACFIKNKLAQSSVPDRSVREWLSNKPMTVRFTVYGILLFSVIVFGIYGFGYDAKGFIYGDF